MLEKLLFPYYIALKSANFDKDFVIVEDNDPSYLKARKLLTADISRQNIVFAPHPPVAPDFNCIETTQKYHQQLLEDYSANITSSSNAIKTEAKAKLKQSWQGHEVDLCWQNRASDEAINLIANRCRMDKGGNHFVDDIKTSKVAK